jgi:hypothetical protein
MPKTTTKPKILKSIIPVESIAKEDINFPEFCFGVIGKIPLKDQPDELEFVDKLNPEAKITISKSKYGLPTQFTRDLRLALMRIGFRKNRFQSRQTPASANEILAEMGLTLNGKNLSILKKHLDILTGARIKFNHSYFDKGEGKQISKIVEFGILSGYEIIEFKQLKGKKNIYQTDQLIGKFLWSDFFYANSVQNARNLIDMDYSLYTQLEGDITKQLYSFLNKRSYGKDILRIELPILAYEKLGINRNTSLSKVRFALKKSHFNLIKTGFLIKNPEFQKALNHKEFVVYTFAKGFSQPTLQEILPIGNEKYDTIKQKLLDLEFTEGQVGKLFKESSLQVISDALDLFLIQNQEGKIKSPKKWLFACLKNGFDMGELEKARALELEEETRLIQETQAREKEEVAKQNQLKQNLYLKEKIDLWIGQNPAKYYSKCMDFYNELKENNNTIFLETISKQANKLGKSEVEIIINDPILSSMVRSKISELI